MFLRESIAANSLGGKFLFRLEQYTDLEAVLRVYILLRDFVRDFMRERWEDLFSGRVDHVQRTGERIGKAFTATEEGIDVLRVAAEAVTSRSYALEDHAAFLDAANDLLRYKAHFEQ